MQTQRDSQFSARKAVENALKLRHPATVQELAQIVTAESALCDEDVVQIVKDMAREGSLVLQEPMHKAESLWDYFLTPTLSLWFWTALGVTALAVSIVSFIPDSSSVVVIRWLLGSIFLLFLPGYALLQLLFPKASEIRSLERFVLGIGLSLALVPLIGLVLSYTPWGLQFIPVTISMTAFTIASLTAAATRKYLYIREQTPSR